jgi:hypothetical protein
MRRENDNREIWSGFFWDFFFLDKSLFFDLLCHKEEKVRGSPKG